MFADWVEANSLNVGSVNLGDAVYKNPIDEVRYCVDQIIKNRKIPEIEVFEIGMIRTVKELSLQYEFVKPILFSIVLGHIGAAPATVGTLKLMIDALYENFPNREDVLWGITHAHREDFEIVKAALDMGASTVRIGFEAVSYTHLDVYKRQDQEQFKEKMSAKAAEVVDEADVILFAQGSMAYCEEYIAEKYNKLVLSSPRFGAAALKEALIAKGTIAR